MTVQTSEEKKKQIENNLNKQLDELNIRDKERLWFILYAIRNGTIKKIKYPDNKLYEIHLTEITDSQTEQAL